MQRRRVCSVPMTLKPCPDEEGIKTVIGFVALSISCPLKPCPDEEGIKTPCIAIAGIRCSL